MENRVEDRAERWFLNALWTGCATGLIRARVPVLDIVLFTKGVPTRWLHTLENGYLIARSFKDQNQSSSSSDPEGLRAALLSGGDDEYHQSSSSSSSGAGASVDAETSLQRLAEAIQNFARFVNRFRGKSASEALAQGDKIALIVYRDGRREAMGLQDLSVMAPHGQWLASVSYMQPMLPLHEVKVGVYERRNLRVGSSIVSGSDFLGSRRSTFLKDLLNRHRFSDTSSVSPQVTDEDIYTMRLVRLLHLLFTIPDGSSLATPFLDDIVGSTGVAPEYYTSLSRGGGGGGGSRGGLSTSASSRRREDMVSSDSESGKRIMTMLAPLRVLRVVGLAVQYAMDSQGRLWISGPLLTAVQPLTPDVGSIGTLKQDGSSRGAESAASRQRVSLFPAPKPVPSVTEKDPKDFGLTAVEAKAAAMFEARGAAEAVSRDIGKLVLEGKSRGLSLELCWQHFDEGMSGRGKISDDIFRERLALLGFTLHDAGFMELKKLVPHNRDGLIGFYEFEQFVIKANEPRASAMRGAGGDSQRLGVDGAGELTDSDDQHLSADFSDSEVKKQELGEAEFPSSSSSMMMHDADASGSSDAFLDAQSAYSALQERFKAGLKPRKAQQGQRKQKLQPPVLSLVQPSDTSYTLDKSLDSGVSLASDAQPRAINTLSQMMTSIGDISAISTETSKPSLPSVSSTYGQQAKPKGFEAAWLKERKKAAAREAQKLALEAERAALREKERTRIELERGKPPLGSTSIQQAKTRRTKKQNRAIELEDAINENEQQTRAIITEGISYEERMQNSADAFLGYDRNPPPVAASPALNFVNDEDAHLLNSFASDDELETPVVGDINFGNVSNIEQSAVNVFSPREPRSGRKQSSRNNLGGLPQGDPYLNFLMKQARPGRGPSAAGGGFTKAGLVESTAQNLFEDLPELAEPAFDPLPQNRLNSLVSASSKFGQVLVPGGAVGHGGGSSSIRKKGQPEISMDTINKTLAMRRGRRLRADDEEKQKQIEHEARMRERHNAGIEGRPVADSNEDDRNNGGVDTSSAPNFSPPSATLLFPEPQEWSFDETTTVLFNIIQGPPSVTTPSGVVSVDAHRSYENDAKKSKRAQPPTSPYASGRAVDILFIPDLYDDIDGLSTSLLSTVEECPGARLLIYQFPGLPGTTCAESVEPVVKPNPPRWSPDFCALVLLHFVRWLRDPARALWGPIGVQHPHGDLFTENEGGMNYRDVVIVGSGIGAHIASIFVTQFLSFVPDFMGHRHSPLGGKGSRDFILMAATRALVLLNGYGFVDKSLKATFDRLGQVHTQLGSIPSTHVSIEELELKKEKGRMIEVKKGDHVTPRPPFENVVAEATSVTLGQNPLVDETANKMINPSSSDNARPTSRKVKERGGDRGSLWQALSIEPMDPKKSQRMTPADIIRSEAVESISTVVFSRSFLEDHGPKTPFMALLQGNEQIADGDPHVDAGLATICRGAARGMDVRPNLRDMPLPLLLINGSENAFVLPHLSLDIAIARARTGIDKFAAKSKQELLATTGLLNGTPQTYAQFLEVAGFPPSQDQLAELCGDGVSDIAAIDDVSVVDFMKAAGLDAEIEKATEFADFESSENKVGWKQPRFRPATVDGSKRFHMVSGPDGKLELRESSTMLPRPVPQMRKEILEARPGTRSAAVREKELSLKDARQANSRPTFCLWLKAGHALLTERRAIVLKTLEAIFKGKSKESRTLQQQQQQQADSSSLVMRNITVNEEGANLVRLYENNSSNVNASIDNDQRYTQNRDETERRNNDSSRFTIPPPPAASTSYLPQSNGLFSSGTQLVSPSSLGYLPSPTAASRPTFIFPMQYPDQEVDVEEMSRQSQARVMVAAELKRRGMNTEGTELELLARLEDALEAEASAAFQTEEDISDSAAVRLRKAMRLEAELEERKKRKEVQAAKTQDLTKPGLVIKRALPKVTIDKNDLVDSDVYTRERKDMQEEDILSSKYAAFLLAQEQRSIDADIIATALTQLRSSGIEHDDITMLSEGILRAIGRDRLEQLFKGGLIAPSLLQKASDQIAVGATKGAAASLAQGLSYLKVVGKIHDIDKKAIEARETALAAAAASKKRFASMYDSDGALERQNAKDEAAKLQKMAEAEAGRQRESAAEAAAIESGGVGLDIRRAFRDLGVDQKRTRAAKLAVLRLSSVFAQLKFEDEERGYALTSEDPESLQLGVRRLVSHVNDVRSRFKSTLKRWSRCYMKTRQTESSVVIEKGRLAILKRSLEMVKRERTRIEYALRAAGVPSKTIVTTDAIMTALREAGEIEIFIEDQQAVIKTKEDVVEFELIDLASHMAALSATKRKMQEKEQALRDMRTHLSMLIAAAKKKRRDAKVDHERSSKEASAALSSLFHQQDRLSTLRLEWIRVSAVRSKWFDTTVWNAGTTVRVLTTDLREWLQDELIRQKIVVAETIAAIESLRGETETSDEDYARIHDEVMALTKTLTIVVNTIRTAPSFASLGVDAVADAQAEAEAHLKTKQAAAEGRLVDDGFDEKNRDSDDDDDEDNNNKTKKTDGLSSKAVGTRDASRRDLSIAWREKLIHREADSLFNLADVFSSQDPSALVDVGGLTEPVPSTDAQLGWITNWMDPIVTSTAEQSLSTSSASRTQDDAAISVESLALTFHHGYASKSTLAEGMSAVIGTPYGSLSSALPLHMYRTAQRASSSRGGPRQARSQQATQADESEHPPLPPPIVYSDGLAAAMAQAEKESKLNNTASSQTQQADVQATAVNIDATQPALAQSNNPSARPPLSVSTTASPVTVMRMRLFDLRTQTNILGGATHIRNGGKARASRLVAPTVGEQMEEAKLRLVPESIRGVLVRLRPAFDRTVEEKKWIAIDRRMHPRLYTHLSPEDAEVFEFDPLYKTNVSKTLLFNLAALPASPLQALPFLRTQAEVQLHGMLAKYLHGQGEDDERRRDQESGARALAQAAVARGFIARTKLPAFRTHEEADWVSLDRLVRPHLYLGEPAPHPVGAPVLRKKTAADKNRGGNNNNNNNNIVSSTIDQTSGSIPSGLAENVETVDAPLTGQMSGGSTASVPIAPPVLASTLNADDAELGLDTYEHNLSFEATRQKEGAFGNSVRRIFQKVFRFNEKKSSQAEKQRKDNSIRRRESEAIRKAAEAQSQSKAGTTDMFDDGATYPPEDDLDEKSDGVGDGKSSNSKKTRVLGATGIQLHGGWTRPSGGTIGLGFTREDVMNLLQTPSSMLKTGKERRAQLLLRTYGSDGGEWMYRTALSHPTPVVTSLRDVPEANEGLLTQLKDRKDVDYSQELACQYPDGDDTNTAACAAIVANGTVLVRANHSIEIFSVSDAPLRPGVTVDHAFEVPGSFFDVAGYGTRARPLPALNASHSNRVAPRQNVIVPSASSCVAMGSPPPWQRDASTVDMVDIAIKEAQAKGIGASSAAIAAAAAASNTASSGKATEGGPKKEHISGGVSETLEKCAPDENALNTQCEIETGIEGALPVAVDMTVTIAFHGGFVDRSYVLGRLTTSLYRDAFVNPSDHPSQAEHPGSVYAPALYAMGGGGGGGGGEAVSSTVPSLTISTSEGRVIQTMPLLLPPFSTSASDEYEEEGKRATRSSLPSFASASRPLKNIQETTRPSSNYSNSRPGSRQNDSSFGSASGVIHSLPSSVSILSAEFDKDIFAGPGLPREPGAYQLGGISGPIGLPPVKMSKAVLSALSYPNDVDPITLQSSVQRNGDVKKAKNKTAKLPPRHLTQMTALTGFEEDVESDPETYLDERSNVMASFAKRHKRRTRMVSENVVKDTEARLNLRRPKGWFLNTESQHAQLSNAFASGAKFSTLSSSVDTRIIVEKSSSIYLRPDGTVASSANEPNVMPSSLVADELFHDESIGADIIGLGMSTKRPTLKRLAATGEIATASSSTANTLVPLWREREDSNQREELTKTYYPEGVDLAQTAASYSAPQLLNSKSTKKLRTRSLDASNSRLRTISTTLRSEIDRSEQADLDEDGFVIVRKPSPPSETQPLGESSFPTFEPARLNNSFSIGVGAASGAGDGSGPVRLNDSRAIGAKQKRPLTYHPSQTPPLARAPLTHVLPSIPQDQVIANSRFAVGYAVSKDCSPNTVDSFGKVVIRHEPLHAPVTPGKYVVSVSGLSSGSYSISVVCGLAYPSHTVIAGSIRAAASAKTKTLSAKEDVRSIIQSQRLGQRKRQLVGHLIHTTDKEMQEIQSSINMLRTALETGVIMRQDLGSDDEDTFDDVGVDSNLKEQIFEDKSGRKVDEDGDSVEDSESEEEVNEDAGVVAAKRRRKLKDEAQNDDDDPETAMAKAILIARKKRQRLDVTNQVKTCILKRLKKLDVSLLSIIRVLTTRKREYQDVSDGLEALAEARMRRESDLERLLSQNQEYAESMPAIAKSVLSILHDPVHGQMATTTANLSLHTKQNSKLERFGVHNIQELMSLTGTVEAPEDSALIKALSNEVSEAEKKMKKKSKKNNNNSSTSLSDNNKADNNKADNNKADNDPSALKPEDDEDETLESGECFAVVTLDGFSDGGGVNNKKSTNTTKGPLPTIVRSSTRLLQQQMFVTRFVDYRYNYPEPDHDAVVYSSRGPFFLLWKTALESSKLLDAASTPADLVRSKRIEDLTAEERKWMSLDRVIHPEFYSFGTAFAAENEDFATKYSPSKSPSKGIEMEGTVPVFAAAVSSSGLTTISEGPLPESSSSSSTGNAADESVAPETKLDGRFDLTVSNKTMFKALYLSVEDKTGLRGNNRDVGKQATTLQLREGAKGMIEYSKGKVPDLNLDNIEMGLPSELGGLGWALENLHEHKSNEKKTALSAGTSALDKLLPKCEYQRIELLRIRSLPIHQLSLEERSLRKLLVKFHEHSMRPNLARTLRARVQTASNAAVKTVGSGIGGGPAKDLYYDEETRMWMMAGDHSALPPHRLANAAAEFSKMRRFQAVGSPFAMARSAVPIPSGAPLKLRKVLQERAVRLQKLWDEANQNMQHSQAINKNAIGKGLSSDVDERSRELLDELDRINSLSLDAVDSSVLHGMEQRFTPSVLIDQLEMEIDRVLLSQVYEREAVERALLTEATDIAAESAAKKAALEAKAIRDKREVTIQKMVQEEDRRATQALQENIERGKRVLLTNEELAERARLQAVRNTLEGASSSDNKKKQLDAQKAKAKRWNGEKSLPIGGLLTNGPEKAEGVDNGAVEQDQDHIDWGGGDYFYDSRDPLKEIGGLNLWGDPLKPMTPRRAARLIAEKERKKAEQEADTKAGTDVAIGGRLSQMTLHRRQQKMAARQLALKEEGKNTDDVHLLLPNQCRACFTVPCQWTPCLSASELEAIKSRQALVEAELFRVRRIKFAPSMRSETHMIKSTVALSYLQGGPLHQTKEDLVFELAFETSALKSAVRLRSIDEELHSAYASRFEEFTTVALHGHPQRSWRANVIVQIEAEISRIVAREVSNDLIEDVLNFMLEGWHFGERSSTQIVAGYVPNLNNLRPLRPFESSSKAAATLALQGPSARARAMDAARGLLPAVNSASTVNAAAVASLARSGFITMSLTGQRLDLMDADSKVPDTSMTLSNRRGEEEGGSSDSDPQVLNFVYSVFNNKRPDTTMSSTKPLYIPIPTQESIREAKRAAKLAEVGVEPSVSDMSRTVQVKNEVLFPAGFIRVEDEEQAHKLKEALLAQRTLHTMLQNTKTATSLQHLRQASSSSSSSLSFNAPTKSLALAIIPNVEGLSPKSQQALAIRGSRSVGLQSSILKTQFGARMLSLPAEALGQGQRPSLQSAAAGIGYAAEARAAIRTALSVQAKVIHSMEETEVTLRYGMFLLALMYFRIMNQLSRLRTVFAGNAVFTSEDGEKIRPIDTSVIQSSNILGLSSSTVKAMTLERQGMVQAEMNKMRREGAKALSNAKAAAGFAAMHARKVARETSARLDAIREERKRVRLNRAATKIQSVYRGVHVRKTIGELRLRQNAYSEFMVLKTFAAVRIQAAWRGHVARAIVLEKRRELENFIKFYRAMEADDMLSEYYNQNLLQRLLKKNATKSTNEDEEVLRLSIAQARLVDDAEINRRLGKAKAKEPIPTYGNLARTDKHDLGKTQEQIDFEEEEQKAQMRYARAIQEEESDRNRKLAKMKVAENRAEYVGTGKGIPLAEAIKYEDQNGYKREELDLDRPGRDSAFFNIREPKVHIPVGMDRLRVLMQQGYAHATSRAFAAEKASVYETGLVQDTHLLLKDDDDDEGKPTMKNTTKVKYSERWANRTGEISSQNLSDKIAAFEEKSKAKSKR